MHNLERRFSVTSLHCLKRLRACVVVMMVVALTACAAQQEVSVQRETTQTFAPTTLVTVLPSLPSTPYTRIAILDVQAAAGTPMAQLIAQLQAKAAALGANAIVVQNLSTQQGGTLQFNPSGGEFTTTPSVIVPHLRAVALRLNGKE